MAKVGIATFFSQVRQEVSKVTWATRRETIMATIMVLVMVSIVALFFFLVDAVLIRVVQAVLGF